MTSHGRRTLLEDKLKKLIMSFLSILLSEIAQILNLSFCDQGKNYKCIKWRQPSMEDDLRDTTIHYTQKVFKLSSQICHHIR